MMYLKYRIDTKHPQSEGSENKSALTKNEKCRKMRNVENWYIMVKMQIDVNFGRGLLFSHPGQLNKS